VKRDEFESRISNSAFIIHHSPFPNPQSPIPNALDTPDTIFPSKPTDPPGQASLLIKTMQPPTPTKNHRPATTKRTFVHANGALLAEQEVIEYQQTPYEILRFVHQDASGSGVQQTLANGTLAVPNGRTAEYDAMGRNVADPGPYVTLNTQVPSENGSGIDLFGNGEGYRPGRRTFTVNGFPIPESAFNERYGSFAFYLLDSAARMSTYQFLGYTLRYGNGDETFAGFDEARAISRMEGGETLVRNWLVNDSWSVITMIIPQTGGKPAPLTDKENRELDTRIEKLINDKLPRKSCKDFLIGRLGQSGYNKLIETLRNQGLRYSALRSTDITVEEADLYNNLDVRQALIYLSDRRNTRDGRKRDEYKDMLESLDWSVSRFAKSKRVHAILGRANGEPVVYYASFKKITTILHENLHISTGLKDIPLAAALGLKDDGGNDFTDLRKASAAISKALIEKGCTN